MCGSSRRNLHDMDQDNMDQFLHTEIDRTMGYIFGEIKG